MKKLLLIALMFAGVALFAAKSPAFVVDAAIGEGTVEDKGIATRVKDNMSKKGVKRGVSLYFDIKGSDWQTVKFTVAAEKGSFALRGSQGGTYECKSFKVNGEEKLTEPYVAGAKKGEGKKIGKIKGKADGGKMTVELQVRAAGSAE